MEKLGQILHANLKKKEMTISELAKEIGIEEHLVENWFENRVLPSTDSLLKLIQVLDIQPQLLSSEREDGSMITLDSQEVSTIKKFEKLEKKLESLESFQDLCFTHGSQIKQVLIVEPNEIYFVLLKQLIGKTSSQIAVQRAFDTLSLVKTLSENEIHMIFMNRNLSEKNEEEILKIIRQNNSWQKIPIFLFSPEPYTIIPSEEQSEKKLINLARVLENLQSIEVSPPEEDSLSESQEILMADSTEEFKFKLESGDI